MSKIIGMVKKQLTSQLEFEPEKDSTPVKSKAKSQKKVSAIEDILSVPEEVVKTKSKTKTRSKASTANKKAVETEDEDKSQVSIVEEVLEKVAVLGEVVKDEATSDLPSKPKPILLTPEQIKARDKTRLLSIYQAIGRIQVRIKLYEGEATILFGDREFSLFSAGFKKASRFTSLERVIAEQGSDLEIIVYPIIDNNQNLVVISFSYLNTVNTKNDRIYQDLRPNYFRLSGLWKTIDGQTCIQVHSNMLINPCIRSRLKQPLNVPIQWNDCPIQEEPKKNIYVSIEAEFNFESCKFDYVRTLINPTKSHPPFPKYHSYIAPN
ncbi:hypothetical protein [Chamaesiphon sp. OTE_20_metabat_361]|uniref:hypothetical protein n=1 Tax=Chamaesiphon sp. OTE_20_metabat_361 TaxID=2964689 RepID=UPI00286CB9D4|nr:hypothetical protein [Chamaesiphon sp. OTE_20_metabat_361]